MTSQKMDIFYNKDPCIWCLFPSCVLKLTHTHTNNKHLLPYNWRKPRYIYLIFECQQLFDKKQWEHMGPWNHIPTGLQSAGTELWQPLLTGPVPPYHHSPSPSSLFLLVFTIVFHFPTCPITIYVFIASSRNSVRSFSSFNMFDSWSFWLRHWKLQFYAFF